MSRNNMYAREWKVESTCTALRCLFYVVSHTLWSHCLICCCILFFFCGRERRALKLRLVLLFPSTLLPLFWSGCSLFERVESEYLRQIPTSAYNKCCVSKEVDFWGLRRNCIKECEWSTTMWGNERFRFWNKSVFAASTKCRNQSFALFLPGKGNEGLLKAPYQKVRSYSLFELKSREITR